ARLGDHEDHSPLDAEVAGILLAAHLILKSPNIEGAVIFTDSQLAVRSLEGEIVGASPALVRAASRAIRNAARRAGGISVRLRWCPGHGGVRGNQLADREAKAAAGG
ncbi:hypothetical protein BDV93DRAFT_407005, partial [Ceratobasidium sp. AG-I]